MFSRGFSCVPCAPRDQPADVAILAIDHQSDYAEVGASSASL
eukprot:CAMPEP_0175741516 /NCGR_PEP_ID=MMETSP0097-20121207/56061_1 /TAXON_ID=311494 /ORGANISM="Alexandrium monilatum, Strain CCMP3105" /LENGTH=41 /DNA_ID= /DNA_START= /DNA_END= /DNA_ORIENTATION=